MPSHAPRDYPIRKKLNLQKQEHRLVHAIKNKLNTTQTEKAAELVRKAQLGYAKARHDLELHKHPNDIRHDQLKKGEAELARWEAMPVSEIIELYQRAYKT